MTGIGGGGSEHSFQSLDSTTRSVCSCSARTSSFSLELSCLYRTNMIVPKLNQIRLQIQKECQLRFFNLLTNASPSLA